MKNLKFALLKPQFKPKVFLIHSINKQFSSKDYKFKEITQVFREIELINSRNEKQKVFTQFL